MKKVRIRICPICKTKSKHYDFWSFVCKCGYKEEQSFIYS
jgi:hypothetical protein